MTLSDLDGAVGQWLTHRYHHRTHPETKQTPLQRWLGTGWLPRMPETLEELNLLLLTVATPRNDYFDGSDVGIVLIGMPGFERRLARYPQLYSASDSPISTDRWTQPTSRRCCPSTGRN